MTRTCRATAIFGVCEELGIFTGWDLGDAIAVLVHSDVAALAEDDVVWCRTDAAPAHRAQRLLVLLAAGQHVHKLHLSQRHIRSNSTGSPLAVFISCQTGMWHSATPGSSPNAVLISCQTRSWHKTGLGPNCSIHELPDSICWHKVEQTCMLQAITATLMPNSMAG